MLMRILFHYYNNLWVTRWLNTPEKLLHYQQRQFKRLAKNSLIHSVYYRPFIDKPLSDWPMMNKQKMMSCFDDINTVNIKKDNAMQVALLAETSRDFSSTIGQIAVGLSSGTSGQRGMFLTSPKERDLWAGIILAKVLPHGLSAKERIAFFLRSNNPLYMTLNKSKKIQFHFFDLMEDFDQNIALLNNANPTILSAPASVLLMLARQHHRLTIKPTKIISVAEVLEAVDEVVIARAFQLPVSQVYQCTEGLLAVSDKQNNRLVMNEENLIIEKEWLDDTRFVPIITDLRRTSQPIIRYRLDDILIAKRTDGVFTELAGIEGRLGDVCYGKRNEEAVPIFADSIRQHMARSPVEVEDYAIQQQDLNTFNIQVIPEATNKAGLISHLNQLFIQKVCALPHWQWQDFQQQEKGCKQRRIRGFK